ncbi:MAG: phospholipase D-like domain-containing protein, partial [Candidatus Woesearchaeota archaeon]
AVKKGAKIKILASKEADTNHHTNMWFLSKLLKLNKDNISIFLSDTMIHTKGMANANKVIIGAANFHNANGYFKGLNEQNIYSENKDLVDDLLSYFEKDISESTRINNHLKLPKFSRIKMIKEMVFVWLSSYFILLNKKKIQRYRDMVNKRL